MFQTYTNMQTKQQVLAVPVKSGKITDLGEGKYQYAEYPHSIEVEAKSKPQVGDFIVQSTKTDTLKLVHYSEFLTKCLPTATRLG